MINLPAMRTVDNIEKRIAAKYEWTGFANFLNFSGRSMFCSKYAFDAATSDPIASRQSIRSSCLRVRRPILKAR
jgi:hypothetical protein